MVLFGYLKYYSYLYSMKENDKIKMLENQLKFHIEMGNKGMVSILEDKIKKLKK